MKENDGVYIYIKIIPYEPEHGYLSRWVMFFYAWTEYQHNCSLPHMYLTHSVAFLHTAYSYKSIKGIKVPSRYVQPRAKTFLFLQKPLTFISISRLVLHLRYFSPVKQDKLQFKKNTKHCFDFCSQMLSIECHLKPNISPIQSYRRMMTIVKYCVCPSNEYNKMKNEIQITDKVCH